MILLIPNTIWNFMEDTFSMILHKISWKDCATQEVNCK